MLGVSVCLVVWVRSRERGGFAGYQPGVYVPLKALFLVFCLQGVCIYPWSLDQQPLPVP